MAAIALALAFGCRGAAPHHYLLHPVLDSGQVAPQLAVGVGPFVFAEYLDRLDIVERLGDTRVKLRTTHLWAEPLSSNFTAVVAANIGGLLGSKRVSIYPWHDKLSPDVIVSARISQLDFNKAGEVVLRVSWTVERKGSESIAVHSGTYRQKSTSGKKMAQVTEAMSQAVAQFSRDVVRSIR